MGLGFRVCGPAFWGSGLGDLVFRDSGVVPRLLGVGFSGNLGLGRLGIVVSLLGRLSLGIRVFRL